MTEVGGWGELMGADEQWEQSQGWGGRGEGSVVMGKVTVGGKGDGKGREGKD